MRCRMSMLRLGISLGTLLVVTGLSGCFTEENDLASQQCGTTCVTLNGVITTSDGTVPVANATLQVHWSISNELSGIKRLKAEAETDASGYYEMNFEVREDEMENGGFEMDISGVGRDYFKCFSPYQVHYGKLENNFEVTTNYLIPYQARLRVTASGLGKMNDEDRMTLLIRSPFGVDGQQGCGNYQTWNTHDADTTLTINVSALQPVVLSSTVTHGQNMTETSDTIFLSKGQLLDYKVEFGD